MLEKIIILDSHALIHRAFHGIRSLNLKDGTPINAVYGFTRILLKIIEEKKPEYFVVVKDLPSKTFRHDKFVEYKATREKASEDLYSQIPLVYELLDSFGIPVLGVEGFEADDIAGTISKSKKLPKEIQRLLVTGDMDYLQLVDDSTVLVKFKKGFTEVDEYDLKKIRDVFNLSPEQIIDLKGLKGDASDNIPGVKGIGEKTALKLLNQFKSLDNIYKNLSLINSDAIKNLLIASKEQAYLSLDLARIDTNVKIDFDLSDFKFELENHLLEINEIFKKFEFFTLMNRLERIVKYRNSGSFITHSFDHQLTKKNEQSSLF